MIDRQRGDRWARYKASRGFTTRLSDSAHAIQQTAERGAHTLVDRLKPESEPRFIYVVPNSTSRLVANFAHDETFTHIPFFEGVNPLKRIRGHYQKEKDRIKKGKPEKTDIHRGVVVKTAHPRDIARNALDENSENIAGITGFDLLVGEIMQRVGEEGTQGAFTHVEQDGKRYSLRGENGLPTPLHKLFDPMHKRRGFKDGSSIRFISGDKAVKVTFLTNPHTEPPPQVSLIGSRKLEFGSLDELLADARHKGERVVVAYKAADQGLISGFVQPTDDTDIFEVSLDKNRVTRINGVEAKVFDIPAPEKQKNPEDNRLQIVAIPISDGDRQGSIEDYIKGTKPLPSVVTKKGIRSAGVAGIDVVRSGNSIKDFGMALDIRGVIVEQFRPDDVERWYKQADYERLWHYLRLTAIIPSPMVVVQTEQLENTVVESPKPTRNVRVVFDRLMLRKS